MRQITNHITWWRRRGVWLLPGVAILIAFCWTPVKAADNEGFNIQVSPSPLFIALKPGEQKSATLMVRNLSSHTETIQPSLNGFTIDDRSEKIELQPEVPLGLDTWIRFKQQSFTLAPGKAEPLEIIYNTPKNVGFSYAVAITLSPKDRVEQDGAATIQPKVAVFNLINIDRPDAKRQLTIEKFASDKSRYEFLPAAFSLTVRNEGNVIDQPVGTLFIQRSFDDAEPVASIPLNKANSYVLPDTSRTITNTWEEGFPRFVAANAENNSKTTQLSWNWRDIGKLRMGKYVAKVVVVYNDGQRDIPLIASTTFWVIPWKLILISIVVGGLIVTGLVAWIRLILKGTKTVRKYAHRRP